ncbi:MAG: WXG100 family type VII secretion target [Eubacterium sp.]|nr:WXG100 family type VII secretion target [Eubacterium sp.]
MSRLGSDAQLRVTTEELQAKSNSVNSISTRMNQEYNELRNIINRTSSYWIGKGGDAHRRKLKEQEKDVDDMFRRIKEHIVDLQTMAGVYNAAEQDIVSTIQSSLPSDVII